MISVELKWVSATNTQPNFVFYGADNGAYGYQFYKGSRTVHAWFLCNGWNDETGNGVSFNPVPEADVFHTFRVYDKGDGNRSSQLDDRAVQTYSFSNSNTLSSYTASRENGNGMFLQFGNDNGDRNFTVKFISFYSEETE